MGALKAGEKQVQGLAQILMRLLGRLGGSGGSEGRGAGEGRAKTEGQGEDGSGGD